MLKPISQVAKESQNLTIQELYNELKDINKLKQEDFPKKEHYQILKTVICDDCMHGNHEVIGHPDCECACHGNPECFVCGHNLLTESDIKAGAHPVCEMDHNDMEHDRYLDQLITKYGDELFDR